MKKWPLFLFVTLLLAGCGYPKLTINNSLPSKSPAELSGSYNQFAIDLFQKLNQKPTNFFFSPVSAAVVISLASEGANGTTKTEMKNTLHIQSLDSEALREETLGLFKDLNQSDAVTLLMANGIFTDKSLKLNVGYAKTAHDYYLANAEALVFSEPSSVQKVNNWVSQQTDGKIDKMVDKLNGDLLLMNAIYFKADWTHPFDSHLTQEQVFHSLAGEKKVAFMHNPQLKASYYKGPDFQSIMLPYGQDRTMSMRLFLPDQQNGLQAFYKELTFDNLTKWDQQFRYAYGDLKMPKLDLQETYDLKAPLQALGMTVPFTSGADFHAMTAVPSEIADVFQKTYVKVDEQGTEAAAATGSTLSGAEPAPPSVHFQLVFDHPYFFTIEDNESNTILFMGAVESP